MPIATLGTLATAVVERYEVHRLDRREIPAQTVEPPPQSPPLFVPVRGRTETTNIANNRRMIVHSLSWEDQNSINDFESNAAYEHDFKLFNSGNLSSLRPFCLPGQSNNFWADRANPTRTNSPTAGRTTWDSTNFPSNVGLYFDTDVSDSCETLDLTIGLYHPRLLSPAVQYGITIVTDAGDENSSSYSLNAQKLERICDSSPNCVGLSGSLDYISSGARERLGVGINKGQLLIGRQRGVAPECRTWIKGMDSQPCG